MPSLGPSEWSVEDVCEWLKELELPDSVVESFKENAVAGAGRSPCLRFREDGEIVSSRCSTLPLHRKRSGSLCECK
jgi:hypothetical protein